MVKPEVHFLDWQNILVDSVADWLLARPERLPNSLVIVPTAHSGRRLRARLALRSQSGVLSPKVATPDAMFRVLPAGGSVDGASLVPAPEDMLRAAWCVALLEAAPEELEALVPDVASLERDFSWAMSWVGQILPTLALLNEAGIAPEQVPERCPAAQIDSEKWQCLGKWARHVENRLAHDGYLTPDAAKRAAAMNPVLPAGTRHLVLACVPDPVPLACLAWQNVLERGAATVDVLIHAPAEEAAAFDSWGRPDKQIWAVHPLPLPGQESAIRVAGDARDAAEQAVAACAGLDSADIAFGVPDASLVPVVERAFATAGWPVFDPDGTIAGSTGLRVFLAAWNDVLVGQPTRFAAVSRWLRTPAAWDILHRSAKNSEIADRPVCSPFQLARALDALQTEFLPETLADAERGAQTWVASGANRKNGAWLVAAGQDLLTAFTQVMTLREGFRPGQLASAFCGLWDLLAEAEHDDGADGKLLDMLAQASARFEVLERAFPQLPMAHVLSCWSESLREIRTTHGHEEAVLDVLGWLELPYQPGPHLIVVGMHEGIVPDGQRDDALLPDSVRGSLGLRDRATRMARDAFLLRGMVASRAQGSVVLVVAKSDGHGEPCKPSALLLRCPPEELPRRVMHCFKTSDVRRRVRPAAQRGDWRLDFTRDAAREAKVTASMSPSKIRDYLKCPFQFYLKHVLRMERYEPDPRELDPRQFGNLIHKVMESFGRAERVLRDSDDVEVIRAYFLAQLRDEVQRTHGAELALPLLIQVSSAQERLMALAERQAKCRAQGWEIRHVEYPIGLHGGPEWRIQDCPMSMIIDRIDFNPSSRTWRILDYKTGAKVKSVSQEHLESHRDGLPVLGELLPPAGRQKSPRRWSNVQLPLYAACFREVVLPQLEGAHPSDAIEVGYVMVPPAVSGINLEIWQDYDVRLESSAIAWSEEVVRRIRAGIFGPPVALPDSARARGEFAEMVPDSWDDALSVTCRSTFLGEEVQA